MSAIEEFLSLNITDPQRPELSVLGSADSFIRSVLDALVSTWCSHESIGVTLYFNAGRSDRLDSNEFACNESAKLTLANGQVVVLDESASNAIQGVTIDVEDARVEYAADAKVSSKIEYNELSTPVGCQYQCVF